MFLPGSGDSNQDLIRRATASRADTAGLEDHLEVIDMGVPVDEKSVVLGIEGRPADWGTGEAPDGVLRLPQSGEAGGERSRRRKTGGGCRVRPPWSDASVAPRHALALPDHHPHSENPHTWHFMQPSANSSWEPQSGQAPVRTGC